MKKTTIKRATAAIMTIIIAVTANVFSIGSNAEEINCCTMAEEIIALVNQARAEAGLDPIYAVPYLNDIAEKRAEENINCAGRARVGAEFLMAEVDYDIVPWSTVGEISASDVNSAEEAFAQWKDFNLNWEAIINPDFTHMGVGAVYDTENGHWDWEVAFVAIDVFEAPDGVIEGQYLTVNCKENPVINGDMDGNGIIDSFDYVMICRYLSNQITLDAHQLRSADVLSDGNVSWSDAAVLRNYILGTVEAVPVRF